MMQRVQKIVGGNGLGARTLRGSVFTLVNFGGSQILRLASNLILTRLLMPEAFGLMALVQVFLAALEMFSDTGLNASVVQNKRGTEPVFLNTVWTVQILRGVLLTGLAVAFAGPVARFYDEPMLALLLPVAGLNALFLGFLSTRVATADRNLMQGRLTGVELGAQVFGILVTVGLALWWVSVWALVIGWLVGTAMRVVLSHVVLQGERNRLHLDGAVFLELFHFGKYIFVSSAAGFLIMNGDRAILGKFVPLDVLGIYNIGYFLGSVPMLLAGRLAGKVVFPLYAASPPWESDANRARIARARLGLTVGLVLLCLGFALTGDWLVGVLYTDPYALAGPILVLTALAALPNVVLASYSGVLLAAGKSRDFMIFLIAKALLQTVTLLVAVQAWGVLGAIVAPAVATLLSYPLLVAMIRPHKGADLHHDALFFAVSALATAAVFWIFPDLVSVLLAAA